MTIKNLTHLDLVDTRISHIVLARIAHAHNLQSLTLHGIFEEPSAAAVVFASDHVIDGVHTFLPHLLAFRFVLVGHDDEYALYHSVTQFLRQRRRLRRLDLGSCPWELVLGVLPELDSLRVLGVRIANLGQTALEALVDAIPEQMLAISLSTVISDKPLVRSIFFPSSIVFYYYLYFSLTCQKKKNFFSFNSTNTPLYFQVSQLFHFCISKVQTKDDPNQI